MTFSRPSQRPRRGFVLALTVVGSILAFFAVFAIWVSRQLLETDTWTNTSSQLLEDPHIQGTVAGFLADSLYSNVDVQAQLAKALPERARPLAGPAAGALRELANRLALEALHHPRVQEAWEQANRTAQLALLAIVRGETPVGSIENGEVTLDLSAITEQVGSELGVDVAGKLPADAGTITILKSDQLGTAQDLVNALRPLALALTLVSLALFGAAIFLARGWRREAVRACGFAFIIVGIAALATRALAGHYVVNTLASTESVRPAAQAAWDIGTSLLKTGAAAVVLYGIVIVLGAWLAGPGRLAVPLRRELTPVLRDPRIAYPLLAVVLLLVFWWDPTPGTSRVVPSIALIVLAAIGVEALRRVAVRDFPEETMAVGSERWRGRLDALLARFHRRGAEGAPEESRIEVLERLARLHASGALSDAEFEREKALIAGAR